MYNFACSERTIDIDSEEGFNKLVGDELSELLCEDRNFINWFNEDHKRLMSGFDIVTVLSVHPVLIGHFYKLLKDKRTTKREDWKYLVRYQPHLAILNPY